MALGSLHRQTGNRDRLTPQRIPSVLDLESPQRPDRSPSQSATLHLCSDRTHQFPARRRKRQLRAVQGERKTRAE
jgi:hypothetical protein